MTAEKEENHRVIFKLTGHVRTHGLCREMHGMYSYQVSVKLSTICTTKRVQGVFISFLLDSEVEVQSGDVPLGR